MTNESNRMKIGTRNGVEHHFSVGAIIKRENKGVVEYLMMDRAQIPFGWACSAGHLDSGEDSLIALDREVKEETGLRITKHNRLIHRDFLEWNKCKYGMGHEWDVYEIEYSGEVQIEAKESKNWGWFSVEKLKNMNLEPVWEYFLKKLQIL